MYLQLKALFAVLAGTVAGFATWLLVDASGLTDTDFAATSDGSVSRFGYFLYQFVFSVLLCLMTAGADAIFRETSTQRRTGYWISFAVGLGAGLVGPLVGLIFSVIVPVPTADPDGSLQYLLNVLLLAFSWSIIGGAAGAVAGLSRRSSWLAKRGALGGAAGTLVGAFLFQLTPSIFDNDFHSGATWRLGTIVLAGGLSSFMATSVPDAMRQVWLKIVDKKGHGVEYIIARSPFRIGRDEDCDIITTNTKGVAPVHLIIEAVPQTNRHRLRHAARSPGGRAIYAVTAVNDEPMTSEKWLSNGDKIEVSDLKFEFHEKATHVEKPEAPPVQDKPYAEDRNWNLQSQTRAIPRSMLPIVENMDDEPIAAAPVRKPLRTSTALRDKAAPPEINPSAALPSREGGEDSASAVDEPFKAIGTRLACIGGPYQGQSFPLTHQAGLIGRALDHAVALPADTSVSRVHARIVYEGGRHKIADAGSQNGLTVNDILIADQRTLEPGDVISIGNTLLRYE